VGDDGVAMFDLTFVSVFGARAGAQDLTAKDWQFAHEETSFSRNSAGYPKHLSVGSGLPRASPIDARLGVIDPYPVVDPLGMSGESVDPCLQSAR